jgi:ubiquinone/menaquinone biosynthesis C-methylase UbiE
MTATATPDLAAITERMRSTWASGDYAVVGGRISITSEHLVDAADLRSGDRVLDVAAGSGNASLAAARAGCDVTGVDFVPTLLERARIRATAEGLPATFTEGDAQALPFEDGSFDASLSVFGVMFAPDQEACAREMARVTRSGGTIALANWTPDGFVGDLLRTVSGHVPPPPGIRPGVQWGDEGRLTELFGDTASSIRSTRRNYVFRYPSADAFIDEFRRFYGPVHKAFGAVGDGAEALTEDLRATIAAHDRRPDETPIAVTAAYLETVITNR